MKEELLPMSLDELYQEMVIEHYKNPRNFGKMEDAQIVVEDDNPFCGDQLTVYARVKGETIEKIMFEGRGCSISQSSASMMTCLLEGETLEEASRICSDFRIWIEGRRVEREERFEELTFLRGVIKFSVRVKCALLAWNAFLKGIEDYMEREKSEIGQSTE